MTRYATLTLTALIAVCILAGLGCWTASYVPFEWVKPRIDAFSNDGDAERFTPAVHTRVTNRLWATAPLFILLSGFLYWRRRALSNHLSGATQTLRAGFADLFRDLIRSIRTVCREDRLHVYMLLGILLLGIVLRMVYLFQPMRHDEAFTFTNYASKPLILALSNYSFPNNHLFHTLLVHIAHLIFGNHPWALRLPAFGAGTLLLPAAYLLFYTLYNRRTALFTTAFLSTSSILIEYTTNARGYTLIALFFLLLLALANHLKSRDNPAAWCAFAVVSSLGFHTVPTMLYPLGIAVIWIFLSALFGDTTHPPRHVLKRLLVVLPCTGLLTVLLYLPVLLGSGLDAIIKNRFVQSTTWSGFLSSLPVRAAALWHQWHLDLPAGIGAGLGVAALVSLVFHKHPTKHRVPLPLVAAVSILSILAVQRVLPPERVWLFLLPLYAGAAFSGLDLILNRVPTGRAFATAGLTFGLALAPLPAALHNLSTHYPYGPGTLKDAEQLTLDLKTHLGPEDRVLTVATAAPLEFYFRKHSVSIGHLRRSLSTTDHLFVVVLKGKYTLEQVLRIARIPEGDFGTPEPWRRYKSASVYRTRRILPQMLSTHPPEEAL